MVNVGHVKNVSKIIIINAKFNYRTRGKLIAEYFKLQINSDNNVGHVKMMVK